MSVLSFLLGGRRRKQIIRRNVVDVSVSGSGADAPAVSPSAFPGPAGTEATDFSPGAAKRYGEAFVLPRIREARAIVFAAAALGVAILEGVALVRMVPLHEKVPYMATISDDGRLVPDERYKAVRIENVQQAQITASLKRFARYLLTIDSQLKSNFPKTALWVRGAAVAELEAFLDKDDRPYERQVKDPALTREVANIAITYGQGKTAFLHIELVERNAGVEVRRLKKLIQTDYDTLSDQVSEENPLGVAISHFSVANE